MFLFPHCQWVDSSPLAHIKMGANLWGPAYKDTDSLSRLRATVCPLTPLPLSFSQCVSMCTGRVVWNCEHTVCWMMEGELLFMDLGLKTWQCESHLRVFAFIVLVCESYISYEESFWTFLVQLIHTEEELPTGSECQVMRLWKWFLGYAHKTQRFNRHFVLPITTQAWFITPIRSVFRDTSFFHLSNYSALMCSFSPACLLLPPLMHWHNSFWPLMSCRSTDTNFLSPVRFKKV